jgi:ribulose-phosphate 3-epimerase
MSRTVIAPSILAGDFSKLNEEIRKVEMVENSWLHLDVMDGNFVPNISFGPCVVKGIRRLTERFLDVHLMVNHPELLVKPFAEIPVDLITFHIEETTFPLRIIQKIKNAGTKVGISLNPFTHLDTVVSVLSLVDLLLIMSVEPGFAGQKFIDSSLEKIKKAKEIRKKMNLKFLIEVDGGINDSNLKIVTEAGADVVVLGSFFFENDFKRVKEAIEST